MTRIIVALVVALIFSGSVLANGFSHKKVCADFKKLAEEANLEGPAWVDSYTRSDGMGVICAVKLVDFKKFVKASPDQFRAGWKERKQKQWNALYCKPPTQELINNGWAIQHTLTFIDGYQHRMIAECNTGN